MTTLLYILFLVLGMFLVVGLLGVLVAFVAIATGDDGDWSAYELDDEEGVAR